MLIVLFAAVGIFTYQLTAPAAAPETEGFSVGRLIESVRSHLSGRTARAERRLSARRAFEPYFNEVRVADFSGAVRISGQNRPDVAAELRLEVFGATEAEAEELARQMTLELGTEAAAVMVRVRGPRDERGPRGRRPRGTLTLEVPRHLMVRVGVAPGPVEIRGVADVLLESRGDATLTDIAGAVTGEHRGGGLRITNARSVDLLTRQSDIRLAAISGDVKIDATGGNLAARQIGGQLRVDARRLELDAEDISGEIRIDNADGHIELRKIVSATVIEAPRTGISLTVARAAPISVTAADDSVALEIPEGTGLTLRAIAFEGAVRMEPPTLLPTGGEDVAPTVEGAIAGGGPDVRIETRRGDIVVRTARVTAQ